MPSKLGPHFIGTPGLLRWLEAGARVFKFDPTSLGASDQIPSGPLVVGKLDQREDRLDLTDWKAYKNGGGTPGAVAAHRFNVQRAIHAGANKPPVDRYLVNARIDVWEDDNEVVPDNPDEARWYSDYCIEMMRLYESIGRRRANFCFAVGTPHIAPGDPADVWPHLLPAIRHARDHGHYLALHEYMGYEADLGVGWKQVDAQRAPVRRWHGRLTAAGAPDEAYPYGYVALRYRTIYDTYLRPHGLHDVPLLITECGCDSVDSVTPADGSIGTWKEHFEYWTARGLNPNTTYAEMLQWYDRHLRQDAYVRGAMVFTVGSVGTWVRWDIAGTEAESNLLRYISAQQPVEDEPVTDSPPPVAEPVSPPLTTPVVSPIAPAATLNAAEAAGIAFDADLDRVSGGASFRVTWTFRNSGQTTWDSGYRLVYSETPHAETAAYSRSPMGATTGYSLAELGAPDVRPGDSVGLTLTLTAPGSIGTHATNWQLVAPGGAPFGPLRWLRAVVVSAAEAPTLKAERVAFRNSVVDYESLQPGRQFTGIWTMRNTGTRSWTGAFRIAYLDQPTAETTNTPRDRLGAKPVYTLQQLSGQNNVAPGETVDISLDLIAPLQPGAYAFHWQLESESGEPFGGVRWLRIGVVSAPGGIGDGSTQRPRPTTGVGFGMNINPDAHGLDIERLGGLSWVRWVFFASRLNLSPEEAYQRKYRSIIQTYAAAGVKSLVILHQDTEWGNAPWDNGGWEQYAESFAKACGRVAAACAEFGDMVAYQIFNEQDSGPDNHSAIGIAAENYAIVLDKAQEAIRRAHPGAVVVFGGLNTGPDNAVRYTRAVQGRLGGRLPVDALAIHPYGRYVRKILFNYGSIGKLSQSLDHVRAAFPSLPIWITEIGVASDGFIGPEHYADIGDYVREVIDEVADNYADTVPVLIWFGWTDLMRNSGILTADGQPKAHVFDAFQHMKARDKQPPAGLEALALEGLEALSGPKAEFKSFFTTLPNYNAVPAGMPFTNRWRFRNSGSTTWGDGYRLVYTPEGTNSDPMSAVTSFDLAAVASGMPVAPGAESEITLNLVAPAQFGRVYRTKWQLRDPQDTAFGHVYGELTVIPAAPSSAARSVDAAFVADHTIPDFTPLVAGTDFNKQWLVRNTGGRQWGTGFRLVFIQGDAQMARGVTAHIVPDAKPGEEIVLSVPMTTPPAHDGRATLYQSTWRLQDDRGAFFGESLWAKIHATPGQSTVDGQPADGTPLSRLANDPTAWYSQLDPRWGKTLVGHGQQRIESWGCLMCCMAMALTAHGARLNPAELNERLKREGDNGFRGANIQFIGPTYVLAGLRQGRNLRSYPDDNVLSSEWTGEDPIQRIERNLTAGAIVLAQVDTQPNNGSYNSNIEQHWVILLRRTPGGDDYLILDPVVPASQVGEQPRSLMLKYGNRQPGRSHDENLRQAIKSTLVYYRG